MCNLNVIIKNKKLSNVDITPFLMAVTSNSFSANSDGDGFYFGRVVKDVNKVNIYKYRDEIFNQNVILSHQRLSTSGFENKYTQPFESNDFIFMHNGVMSQFAIGDKSDTFILFQRLKSTFRKLTKEKTRKRRIVKTIKKIFNNQSGSFSIVLYDKLQDELYYFKNSSTSINFYYNHEMIYFTTNNINDRFLHMITGKFETKEIKDNRIYCINPINLFVDIIGKIKEKKTVYYGNSVTTQYQNGYNSNEFNKLMDNQQDYDNEIKQELSYYPHVEEKSYRKQCITCKESTSYYDNILNKFKCPLCLSDELYK